MDSSSTLDADEALAYNEFFSILTGNDDDKHNRHHAPVVQLDPPEIGFDVPNGGAAGAQESFLVTNINDYAKNHNFRSFVNLQAIPKPRPGVSWAPEPAYFLPPLTPQEIFPPVSCPNGEARFARHTDMPELLIYVDGNASTDGRRGARGGCAFVFGPGPTGYCRFALEQTGPQGEKHTPTIHWAVLRAIIAAFQYCRWDLESFRRIVIASDSENIIRSCTEWSHQWRRNQWRTANNQEIANRDLWELLLLEIDVWRDRGVQTLFWCIDKSLNGLAYGLATDGVMTCHQEPYFHHSGNYRRFGSLDERTHDAYARGET